MTTSKTNSNTGMNSTDISKIIDACGKNGVTLFEMGDIRIDFEPAPETVASVAKDLSVSYDIVVDKPVEVEDQEDNEDFDNLLFEDPEKWDELERQRASGALNE